MSTRLSRREVLGLALASPLVAATSLLGRSRYQTSESIEKPLIAKTPWKVVAVDDSAAVSKVQLVRQWRGSLCSSRLVNRGTLGLAKSLAKDLPEHSAKLLVCEWI